MKVRQQSILESKRMALEMKKMLPQCSNPQNDRESNAHGKRFFFFFLHITSGITVTYSRFYIFLMISHIICVIFRKL